MVIVLECSELCFKILYDLICFLCDKQDTPGVIRCIRIHIKRIADLDKLLPDRDPVKA